MSDGSSIWDNVTGAAGSVATYVTSTSKRFICIQLYLWGLIHSTPAGVGGEGFTFITAFGGSVYELATSGANDAFVTVTSIGGQAYTVMKSDAQQATSELGSKISESLP